MRQMIRRPASRDRQMRAQIAILVAASLLTGCCPGGYPAVSGANPAPFDAFQASMNLAGYEWTCQLLKFGWWENNQLLVYIAQTPDGRGAVNSWSVRKG